MEKVEIIRAMVQELQKRGLIAKQKDIADRLKTSTSTVSSAIHGNPNACTRSFILRLNDAYGSIFNPAWLLAGEGAMLAEDAKREQERNVQIETHQHTTGQSSSSVYVGAAGEDIIISLQMSNRMLKAENDSLKKDVARLTEDKAKLEARVDDLLKALINQNK